MDGTDLVNVHRRRPTDLQAATALLRQVHRPESGVWPTDGWPPLILDRGLEPGSVGGHGPIRYRVAEVDADRIRFVFTRDADFVGFHEFRVEGDELVHELRVEHPTLLLRWAIIPLHDALIEDLFDNLDALSVGTVHPPARRWPLRVRILRRCT